MLMQNFKSAADLEITERQLSALIKVLGMLERRELIHARGVDLRNGFNMAHGFAEGECGTVGCIAGWADNINGTTRDDGDSFLNNGSSNHPLWGLFGGGSRPYDVTTDQAATALRSYLTTGDAKWQEAVGEASGLTGDR